MNALARQQGLDGGAAPRARGARPGGRRGARRRVARPQRRAPAHGATASSPPQQRSPLLWSRRPGAPRFLDLRVGAVHPRFAAAVRDAAQPARHARRPGRARQPRRAVPGDPRRAVHALARRPRGDRHRGGAASRRSTSPAPCSPSSPRSIRPQSSSPPSAAAGRARLGLAEVAAAYFLRPFPAHRPPPGHRTGAGSAARPARKPCACSPRPHPASAAPALT